MTDSSNPTPDTVRMIVLDNGLDISELLADRVRKQVLDQVNELRRDQSYSLRQICGPKFWNTLDRWDAIKAGRYIAYLVSTHQLPLIFDVCPHRSNKRYRLA